ncbi:MAG: hypothetical protein Q9168_007518 [Polycauliona sp. 1 TL-2023]
MSSGNCVNELQHPINAVFGQSRWRTKGQSWKSLAPVLQLASLMLESPASQRFIHSLLETESHHSLSHESHRVDCHFRRSNASDQACQATAKLALAKLSKIVEYHFRQTLPGDAIGNTSSDKELDVVNKCHIINKCHVEILRDGFKKLLRTDISLAELHRERFVLATTLCHEVIHALDDTVPEKCNRQADIPTWHFYESQTEFELGCAWEMEVQGVVRAGVEPRKGKLDMLHALPTLEQKPEALDFDGEQHIVYVHPTEPVGDYMSRLQCQSFWNNTPRTMTMLRISTRPDQTPVPSIGSTEPMEILKARAKEDGELKTLLKAVSRKNVSKKNFEKLRDHRDALAKRPAMAALIRKINEDNPRGTRDEPICLDSSDNEDGVNLTSQSSMTSDEEIDRDLVKFENDDDTNFTGMDENEDDDMALDQKDDGNLSNEIVYDGWMETLDFDEMFNEIGLFEYDSDASSHASMVSDTYYQNDKMDLDDGEEKGASDDSQPVAGDSPEGRDDRMDWDANEDQGIIDVPRVPEPPLQDPYRAPRPMVMEPRLQDPYRTWGRSRLGPGFGNFG